MTAPGDPVAREHLTVLADQLITRGETLGYVLTLALNRERIRAEHDTRVGVEALGRVWEALTTTCDRCNGLGLIMYGDHWHAPCGTDGCKGRGRVLPRAGMAQPTIG